MTVLLRFERFHHFFSIDVSVTIVINVSEHLLVISKFIRMKLFDEQLNRSFLKLFEFFLLRDEVVKLCTIEFSSCFDCIISELLNPRMFQGSFCCESFGRVK